MHFILSFIINVIAIIATSYILPGIHLKGFFTALLVGIVLGLINAILRPILFILTLPINILTLGLFSFIIMGFCVMLASWIVPGFKVDNFWWAILFALIVAFINWLFRAIVSPTSA